MPEFASLYGYKEFEKSVKAKARFAHDDATKEFLKTVIETIKPQRVRRLPEGARLFRAQRGFVPAIETHQSIVGQGEQFEIELPGETSLRPERMVPKAKYVGDGRVNPRGIPCLYLACTPSAAIAEMRPWIGTYITLAQFKTAQECVVVDCSLNVTPDFLWEPVNLSAASEPDAATKESGVWGAIGYAFSKPVAHDEPHLDYVPTQILAETFRDHGYHGIVYKSLLDKNGKNIALFDPKSAIPTDCCLYKTEAASFKSAKVELSRCPGWPESISSDFQRMDIL